MAATTAPEEAGKSILLLVHPVLKRHFYSVFLEWIDINLPGWMQCFDLQELREGISRGARHKVLVPWLQDPVQAWSRPTYEHTRALQRQFQLAGLRVVNPVEHLPNAGKYDAARTMAGCGLRVPTMERIADAGAFLAGNRTTPLPFFVRDEWGHGGEMLLARDEQEAGALAISRFERPLAIEQVLLPDSDDGLFRKFRYVVAGARGVPHHMQASQEWITRGLAREKNDRTQREELEYIEAPCPHHALFMRACKAMKLDFAAFDYSIDRDGMPIVWEANPFPHLRFSQTSLVYRNDAMHRTMAAMAAMYFEGAGLALPPELGDYLDECPAVRRD